MLTAAPSLDQPDIAAPHSPECALVERILASRNFSRSALLSGFLRYICERHLAGNDSELTEHHIGVHVFGRPAGYDCSVDNIVRSYARQLRNRLEDYFQWEGHREPLRLQVPRGGYKPVFTSAATDAPLQTESKTQLVAIPSAPHPVVSSERPSANTARWPLILLSVIATALLVAVCALLGTRRHAAAVVGSPMHSLWTNVFRSDRDTVIVTADSGFGTLQDVLGRRLSLADYTNLRLGSLSMGSTNQYVAMDLASQRYTSMVDLETALAFSHLPEVVPSRLTIRFARDLRMEDLKDNNVILLGSSYTNPWAELFEKNLNFELQGDTTRHAWWFLNRHPSPGEAERYEGERDGVSHRTYARIAWISNMDHNGHVLMLQGLDMAGTQGAADALLHSRSLADVWQRSNACNSLDASFEVLLETTSIGSNAGTIHVVAQRHVC